MSNMLEQGAAVQADWLEQRVSEAVLYRRGSSVTTLSATRPPVIHEVEDIDGFQLQDDIYVFVIRMSDLVINGQPTDPLIGDVIEARGQSFRVSPLTSNRPHFRQQDSTGYLATVYTKRVH